MSELIHARQTILPKRLLDPGPGPDQLQRILAAASAAPDHGMLTPWRFVIVPTKARARLAGVFEQALRERDPHATLEQIAQAGEKAYRAPLLMLAIAQTDSGDPDISRTERLLSAGCALQNMLLTATALGFGSALTTGKALNSPGMAALFSLQAGELALCFVSIGSAQTRRPLHKRPDVGSYVSELAPDRDELERHLAPAQATGLSAGLT